MGDTKIEWTGKSWNPIAAYYNGKRGWMCSKPSPGCKHCYSEAMNVRLGNGLRYTRENAAQVEWRLVNLDEPATWKTPQMCFVESMGDFFHESLPDDFIGRIWSKMLETPQHTFQVLTKRAERMREMVARFAGNDLCSADHIWLGVSVEDRRFGFPRIEQLRQTPAALRFLSVEPLLEDLGEIDLTGIGWVIVGGESGVGARTMERAWAESVLRQCVAARVPCFVKQLGRAYSDSVNGVAGYGLKVAQEALPLIVRRLRHAKGADMDEWPGKLRVRQMPAQTGRLAISSASSVPLVLAA